MRICVRFNDTYSLLYLVKKLFYELKIKIMIVIKLILLVIMGLCGLGAMCCGIMALRKSK